MSFSNQTNSSSSTQKTFVNLHVNSPLDVTSLLYQQQEHFLHYENKRKHMKSLSQKTSVLFVERSVEKIKGEKGYDVMLNDDLKRRIDVVQIVKPSGVHYMFMTS